MRIEISIARQTLFLMDDDGHFIMQFPVSTAANGIGCEKESGCTPLGKHIIRAKIGDEAPLGTVFKARRPTGEVFSKALMEENPDRDWILTRILWLSGLERGTNRLGNVDTMQRYIYIHGTPYEDLIGQPCSHGCIRMRNQDIILLFNQVPIGTEVDILNA